MASSYTKAQLIPNDSKDTKAEVLLFRFYGFSVRITDINV